MWWARRPGPSWAIWLRQEKPLATSSVAGAASRTAGSRTRSAQARRDVVVRRARSPRRRPSRSSRSRARRRSRPSLRAGASRRRSPGGAAVAVAVEQDPLSSGGGVNPSPPCSRNSAKWNVWLASRLASSSLGISLVSSSRKTATQLGSSPTTGMPARISSRSVVEDPLEVAAGEAEEAVVVERPAAAEPSAAGARPGSRRLRAPRRGGVADLRLEVVGERVGPEDHRAAPPPSRRCAEPLAVNVVAANARQRPLLGDAGRGLGERRQARASG